MQTSTAFARCLNAELRRDPGIKAAAAHGLREPSVAQQYFGLRQHNRARASAVERANATRLVCDFYRLI
jgi:DNA-binding transcriptional regulator YdaS (Cro superfamily)